MMNTVVGSAIGGLVAGAVALGAAATMRPSPAPAYGPDPNGAYAMTVANTGALNNGASLQCQPYEEAVLRRALVAGREVTDVTCITRSSGYAPQAAYAQPIGYAPQPVYRDDIVTRPVTRTRTVSQPARQRVSTARREVEPESNRSWGKTAMIIGGSSGAGAGIGGLIAGKKGALIGAAVGGGAAAIYEARKR
jgi:hypothetical protein